MKRNNLDKTKVYIGFHRPINPWQTFKANYFGLPFTSMILYINGNVYTFRHWRNTLQKEPIWNLRDYLMINTEFDCKDLKRDWEKVLLSQKARDLDSLFMRHRCIKANKVILNQLDKKWHYKGFLDMFVNIYYKRRIK